MFTFTLYIHGFCKNSKRTLIRGLVVWYFGPCFKMALLITTFFSPKESLELLLFANFFSI
jgi:hypothetical protein